MRYVDTSVIVAATALEEFSERARAWLAKNAAGPVYISDWVTAEFSAALSVKMRRREITNEERLAGVILFSALKAESFGVLEITRNHFALAASYADNAEMGLRAGDALHLAVAGANKLEVFTLDKRLASAGSACGVATHLI
jgi:uncharacterized protein